TQAHPTLDIRKPKVGYPLDAVESKDRRRTADEGARVGGRQRAGVVGLCQAGSSQVGIFGRWPRRHIQGNGPDAREVDRRSDQAELTSGSSVGRPKDGVEIAMASFVGNLPRLIALTAVFGLLVDASLGTLSADPISWRLEWPRTDFSKHSVPFAGIKSGGPPKDGIPAIDAPRFERLADGKATGSNAALGDTEPVIAVSIGEDARAYPLRVLIWHEIANDIVGGTPVVVTYCPLCNAALVFERVVDRRVLDFGTTGKLRNSDLVMYDRQTESWWQQFTGGAIVGAMTGPHLRLIPSRLESFDRFRHRFPRGQVLVPNNPNARNYGRNPYVGYDAAGQRPFLYDGSLPDGIEPMERVVAVEVVPGRHE